MHGGTFSLQDTAGLFTWIISASVESRMLKLQTVQRWRSIKYLTNLCRAMGYTIVIYTPKQCWKCTVPLSLSFIIKLLHESKQDVCSVMKILVLKSFNLQSTFQKLFTSIVESFVRKSFKMILFIYFVLRRGNKGFCFSHQKIEFYFGRLKFYFTS